MCYSPYARGSRSRGYQPPITTGTTDEILDLRRQIKRLDDQAAAKTRGRYHWTNIPSGSHITQEFNRKYPSLSIHQKSYQEESFPYPRFAPPPSRPSCSFCSSNCPNNSAYPPAQFPAYQQPSFDMSNVQQFPPQQVPPQPPANVTHVHIHHHHHRRSKSSSESSESDESFDESSSSSSSNEERIQRALQHIDHASRILENY